MTIPKPILALCAALIVFILLFTAVYFGMHYAQNRHAETYKEPVQETTSITSESTTASSVLEAQTTNAQPATEAPITTTQITSDSLITADRAKEIALSHAKLSASDVTFITAKLDWEKGTQVYDVEFRSDMLEYEYEIDAVTGTILKYEREFD